MSSNVITRRGFLVGAGAISATIAMSADAAIAAERSSAKEGKPASKGNAEQEASGWRIAPADPDDDDVIETYDCDVLVIGLGQAGSCALRAAAEAGARVAAFEAAEKGNRVIMGGGQVGHINSQFLAERGVPKVDVVEFMNDWQVRSNNRSNPGLVMNYAKNCGACFDWLFDQLTDDDKKSMQIRCLTDGMTGPFMKELSGIKSWIGTAMTGDFIEPALDHCLDVATSEGGRIFWGTKGYKLIQGGDGTVTGAWGKTDDGFVRVNAAQTILATGGYGANEQMRNDLLWEINQLQEPGQTSTAMMDQDGSGICMGVWAGGRVDPCSGTMDGGYWYPTDKPVDLLGATAALWINADGKRYSNEGFGSTELQAMPGVKQPSGDICTVFDSDIETLLAAQPYGHMALDMANTDLASLHATMNTAYAGKENGSAGDTELDSSNADITGDDASGNNNAAGGIVASMTPPTVYAADDFETLGSYLGYEGESLNAFVETIEHYNELCAQGKDTDFGKDPSLMIGLTKPPYYGYKGTKQIGALMVTVGGLLIDADGRVLDQKYNAIPGLWAAGNASGGRFGWQYFTSIAGQSLSMAQTMGMVTGKAAAAQK
ncbi:MAG: FAD-binding protein [Coriobacteriales bacterium]|jgi:fumarate reductase flavoprotein subunit